MKKSVLTLVAIAAGVVASYGQGRIIFQNFNPPGLDAAVTYASDSSLVPAGKAGLTVGPSFSAELAYFLGTTSDSTALTPISATINPFFGSADGDTGGGAGYFLGGEATIPGYTSGTVTLQILTFNGADWASSTVRGASALLTVPGTAIATGGTPAGDLTGILTSGWTVQNANVVSVPEPGTFALAGLGAAAMLIFRRRK